MQALRGLDTPLDIILELEDIEAEIEKLQTELKKIEDRTILRPLTNNVTSLERSQSGHFILVSTIVIVGLIIIISAVVMFPSKQPTPQSISTPTLISVSPEIQKTITASSATAQANPASAEAQFNLGNAYTKSQQWDKALAAYQKAIDLNQNYQAAYANMGVIYFQLGKLDLAASRYRKALELNTNDSDVTHNLGIIYLQQALLNDNQPDIILLEQAVAQFKHTIELKPDLVEPYFGLGVAYYHLNQKDEAINALEKFLTLDDGRNPKPSNEAQRYLQALKTQ